MKPPNQFLLLVLTLFALSTLSSQLSTAFAQGSAFMYQGQLQNNGSTASGTYSLTFSLYNASSGGNQVGGTITNTGVGLTNGLFTVILDFGDPFDGTPYWLQIGVSTNGAALFSALSPRQELTPTPYAITAANVDGLVSASQLVGTLPSVVFSGAYGNPVTLNNPGNSFSGNGAGLTNISAAQVTSVGFGLNFFIGPSGPTGIALDNAAFDTAIGVGALTANTTGWQNTANGAQALRDNTTGSGNTANGSQALQQNTTGSDNTANGSLALLHNTTGEGNTANGGNALGLNTTGSGNTANGVGALANNTTGGNNTANGSAALLSNTTGGNNTAIGSWALAPNVTGSYNTADGVQALGQLGEDINNGGTNNIALGYQAGYNFFGNESSNIDIGNLGVQNDYNIIRIGSGQSQTFIAGVINGNGGGLTNLDASQLTSGAVPSAALTSVPAASLTGTVPAAQLPAAVVTNTETGVTLSGTFGGNGGGLTNLNASQLTSIGNAHSYAGGNFFIGPAGNTTTSGYANTGNGVDALLNNTTGWENTANGLYALLSNTTGNNNTANGVYALASNTSGFLNTANGGFALGWNSSGAANTANGYQALFFNTDGNENTADGVAALANNTSGSYNTAIGNRALLGATGSDNIALGYSAGENISTGNYNIDIGNQGLSTDTNIIRIGDGQTTTYLAGAIMTTSDRNTKAGFEPVDTKTVLERVAALPITRWHYTNDVATPHLGPMAQDFRAAFKLGVDDKHIATVDEEGVALAAIQGLNQKLDEKDAEITELKARLDKLEQRLNRNGGGER